MAWVIVGLGNPGEEYSDTRHNTGRMAVESFAKLERFSAWREDSTGKRALNVADKKALAHVTTGIVGKTAVVLVLPDTFMNKSGKAVSKFIKNVKSAERLVVVYDDLDLPFGSMKVSFNRGSGGHKGIESIARALKTERFARIRIGVCPSTVSGKLRKPSGEKEVVDFILSKWRVHEIAELKTVFKKVAHALELIVSEGLPAAMNKFNSDAQRS